MMTLGALSFAAPLALAGLLALPAIWWLLRLTPPLPTRIHFPPVRLLLKLVSREESAARTPPWLLILRLVLAAVVILGAAHPLLNATDPLSGDGPVLVVVDDGWAAAGDWEVRRDLLVQLASRAARDERPVALLRTASAPGAESPATPEVLPARDARRLFEAMQPRPWPVDRAGAAAALADAPFDADGGRAVFWLSDGLAADGTEDLASALSRFGRVRYLDQPALGIVMRPPAQEAGLAEIALERPFAAGQATFHIRARDIDGRILAREEAVFEDGDTRTLLSLDLPVELFNRFERLDLEETETAASLALLDERWRRRPVGILDTVGGLGQGALLSPVYYLEKALAPVTEVRIGRLQELLARPIALLALPDPDRFEPEEQRMIESWMEQGGTVVRFAGPTLARRAGQDDELQGPPLLPVPLRRGDRVIGGAMSWSRPASLAPFAEASPFAGLPVPPDVVVRRQVLAQPGIGLQEKTWASLEDGTPLVTAERRGAGRLVLVHTTASTDWSNLAISGLFVEMLTRLVRTSAGVDGEAGGPPLSPQASLDAFGRLGDPPAGARAIPAEKFGQTTPGPQHPPGFYAAGETRRALNLSASLPAPAPIGPLPSDLQRVQPVPQQEADLRPWLLTLAVLLFLADLLASLVLRGLLRRPGRRRAGMAAASGIAMALLLAAGGAAAQERPQLTQAERYAMENSLETRLAYVVTGDDEVDETSRLGLEGLNLILRRRTAAELGPPQAIDPAIDELVFFPMIYWPVTGDYRLRPGAAGRLRDYMREGGTILFDTRAATGEGPGMAALQQLVDELDLPRLIPVPQDHVLGRAFYLLDEFPGRYNAGPLWIESQGERINDGVSSVIAGGNDWAAAWALDEAQRPIHAVVPGGERQREMAFRTGVNMVMYVLTGNYKADQVHLPSILERLGQ